MLTDRIMSAFMFRREVYAEVERDTSFTTTAWIIVGVVTFLNQIVSHASVNIIKWLIAAVLGTILTLVGFAIALVVINWVGRTLFNADATFDELVRTVGLASVWQIVGVIGAIIGRIPFLACLLWPIFIVVWIVVLVAWFFAVQEALDLDTMQTVITVVIGGVIAMIISGLTGAILGLLGLTPDVVQGIRRF
jgi:hypothetical protein